MGVLLLSGGLDSLVLLARECSAGAYAATWEENSEICKRRLATLRESEDYREPPEGRTHRQPSLFP